MTRKSAAQMVKEARGRVEHLNAEQVEREMGEGALVVDIREPGELAQTGMIPGAVSIPRGMLEFMADPDSPSHNAELDPDRRVILHCAAGGRSALAADTLKQMGFTNVAHLDGGMTAWQDAGKPVDRKE